MFSINILKIKPDIYCQYFQDGVDALRWSDETHCSVTPLNK